MQTISQPLVVALMTELLQPKMTDRVLEVGTGSGYQAAILSVLAGEVYTIEIVPALGERARATLERLGYGNVRTRIGDGYQGWPERAPFDAIIVTAAPDHIPPALIAQLKPGGRKRVFTLTQDTQFRQPFARAKPALKPMARSGERKRTGFRALCAHFGEEGGTARNRRHTEVP